MYQYIKNVSLNCCFGLNNNDYFENYESAISGEPYRKYKDYVYRKMLVQEYLKK